MLRISDFLSINAPMTPQTQGFLNALLCCLMVLSYHHSRGGLVDDALIAALRSGKVAAGLDVFAGEPNLNSAYLELNNAYLLPHIGSATVETRDAMGFCCLDNLEAFFKGQACPNALTA